MDWIETAPSKTQLVVAYFAAGAATVWTDLPLAEARFLSATVAHYGMLVDLRPFSQSRVSYAVRSIGTAGSVLRFKYSVSPYSSEAAFGPDMSIAALGTFATAWFDIPAAAKADLVRFAAFSQGGDGVVDPAIGGMYIHFR